MNEVLVTIIEGTFEDVFMTKVGRKFLASVVGVSCRWYNIAVSIPRLWRGIEYVDSQSSADGLSGRVYSSDNRGCSRHVFVLLVPDQNSLDEGLDL